MLVDVAELQEVRVGQQSDDPILAAFIHNSRLVKGFRRQTKGFGQRFGQQHFVRVVR